ncbi:MAG: FkbM family methyltransferase [Acidobacteria bacterium]|nr:FkbM family methyltransferase [Acidobacteriota bacterium]
MNRKKTVLYALVLVIAAGAIFYRTEAAMAWLYLSGKAQGCTFSGTLQAHSNDETQVRTKDRILQASRILEKDAQGFHLWQTPLGRYWIKKGSDFSLAFDLAEQDRHIYGTGDQAVKSGDVVLDCGANVGVYTRLALNAGASKVIAIEPAPENLECLRRTFAAETASGRVVVYPKGVWDKDDVLPMHIDPTNSAADSFVMKQPTADHVIELPLTTIDKLVDELHLTRIDYVKMDIEGAEPRALQGARNTIQRFHPRMAISVYHSATDKTTVPAHILAAWSGYQQQCGPCSSRGWDLVFPTVYYYR